MQSHNRFPLYPWFQVLLIALIGAGLSQARASDLPVFNTPQEWILLVPGAGPKNLASMAKFKKFLLQEGYKPEQVVELKYNWRKNLVDIRHDLAHQMRGVEERMPKGVSLTLISHSAGQFFAMDLIFHYPLRHAVTKVISLAGTFWGQNQKPLICSKITCSDLYDVLHPYRNEYLTQMYEQNKMKLDGVEMCSFYSYSDSQVHSPLDASSFAGSKVVALHGYGHLEMIRNKAVFDVVQKECGR